MKITLSRTWLISIGATIVLLVLMAITSAALAQGPRGTVPDTNTPLNLGGGPSETMAFTYQGRLVEGSVPANGNYDFIINLYDNPTVGSPVASCINVGTGSLLNQPVTNGVFTFYLVCGSDNSSVFTGSDRWIEVLVRPAGGTTYATLPRQPISPTPYAFSLYPRAIVSDTAVGGNFGTSVFNVYNRSVVATGSAIYAKSATGSAVRGDSANGIPILGSTETGYAVYGYDGGTTQARGYGGYFYSSNGVGVYGESNGTRTHPNSYAPGVYGRSADGVGVYGVSESNASWIPGILGESTAGTGVAGTSINSNGVYGYSSNDTAGYFYSANYRGVEVSSNASWYAGHFVNRGGSTSAGIYVDGTLYVTGSKSGYVVDIVRNAGPEPLETGDVVEIVGAEPPINGEIPVILVRKASQASSAAIAGIMDQPFVIPDKQTAQGETLPHPAAAQALKAQNTAIQGGDYGSMVTLGSFKAIKVDASYGAIHPGDLLVASDTPGYAMRSDDPRIGTVLGKALDTLTTGQGVIPVLVTLK